MNLQGCKQLMLEVESFLSCFKRHGDLSDLDTAITHLNNASNACQDKGINDPRFLERLGHVHQLKFEHLGDLYDINAAIQYKIKAIAVNTKEDPDMPDLLDSLSVCYRARFEHLGDLADLQNAIERSTEAISLTLDGHQDMSARLENLGVAFLCRFERLENLADIEIAVSLLERAITLSSEVGEALSGSFSNLGIAYECRFHRSGTLNDLDSAIEYLKKSINVPSEAKTHLPGLLNNLGSIYQSRFEHLGEIPDIESSIGFLNEALSLVPSNDPSLHGYLGTLGGSHFHRFKILSQIHDIDKSIDCFSQALKLIPVGHSCKTSWLCGLGNAYKARFGSLNEPNDIEMAINHLNEAVLLSPDTHASRHLRLSDLGVSYLCRFMRQESPEDLDYAIEHLTEALSLTPEEHRDRSDCLYHLGSSYRQRFLSFDEVVYIDKSIECLIQALSIIPNEHMSKPSQLSELGSAYLNRFERLLESADLDKAVDYCKQAVCLTPGGDPGKPERLGYLADIYQSRFDHFGNLTDINQAIGSLHQAVETTPEAHIQRPGWLINLAHSYWSRFRRYDDPEDIHRATTCLKQAESLVHENHSAKLNTLIALGNSYRSLFERLGDVANIDKAIDFFTQALTLTHVKHPDMCKWLCNLGACYDRKFEYSREATDAKRALDCFKEAALSPNGTPLVRYTAAKSWAKLSPLCGNDFSLEAHQQIMDLVPQIIWIGSTTNQRYNHLKVRGNVAIAAASAAIAHQKYNLALEWLEAGRLIVWNQAIQLRLPFLELAAVNPPLAHDIQRVAENLRNLDSDSLFDRQLLRTDPSPETFARKRHQLAAKWEKLLIKARDIDGFHDFMRPKGFRELAKAAHAGPVVMINVHTTYSDAIILLPHQTAVVHVPLMTFSYKMAADANNQLSESLRHRGVRNDGFRRPVYLGESRGDYFQAILSTLWFHVVKPVFEAIDYLNHPLPTELPRITWCATGPLAFLPIHAAGDYDDPDARIYNYAVSSYTPSLSVLLTPDPILSDFRGILAVGQEKTTGYPALPGTVVELDAIRSQTGTHRFTQLEGDKGKVEATLNAMGEHSWLHLACHASQNTDHPLKSAFRLCNGTLDLGVIASKSIMGGGLAFLSACETATGDKDLPEEAVHLGAGMTMAGYPSVIATLWSIEDRDAPVVAEGVYKYLLKDGVPDCRKAARALHGAVETLRREVGEQEFTRWIPYIHIGI